MQVDLGAEQFVIKAQIHAGGRGKGGGVKFALIARRRSKINEILGMTLITHQTGSEGRLVKKVMVAEALDIAGILCGDHAGSIIRKRCVYGFFRRRYGD